MKIILLPLFKFIWASILSIVYSFPLIICIPLIYIFYTFWNFKLPNSKEVFKYELKCHDFHVSPYFIKDNDKIFKNYKFKSVYHYIWNIK